MPGKKRVLTYAAAIQEATRQCMRRDSRVIVVGEGVPDPKGIFGTTSGLREEFGAKRVFDMPLSENGMTGILIGASLAGMRPILVHQRVDFLLLSMDQLVNNAAKWHFMFKGQCVPLVIRALAGRGWGQGPQHSQNFQALFNHIPGLKVVMPSTPSDAKGMLVAAVRDNNPVIIIEHRWLYGFSEPVPQKIYEVPLGKARVVRRGKDVTVAAFSYMVIEALRCADVLAGYGIELEVIDMRSANPLDMQTVTGSVSKTGFLVAADTGSKTGGILAEVVAQTVEKSIKQLKKPPVRIAMPDHPMPTSHFLADACYPEAQAIAAACFDLLGVKDKSILSGAEKRLTRKNRLDTPDFNFKGPF